MTCPLCDSSLIQRSRRRGVVDDALRFLGRWPYRCLTCGLRFRLAGRALHPESATEGAVENNEAGMCFRSSPVMPTAKVVIAAKSQQQLDHILNALANAVTECEHHSRPVRHDGRTSGGAASTKR